MRRAFFSKSIAELEQMFEQQSKDAQFLNQLKEELAHRSTQRADRLRCRLTEAEKSSVQTFAKSTEKIAAPSNPIRQNNSQQDVFILNELQHRDADMKTSQKNVQSESAADMPNSANTPVDPMSINFTPSNSISYQCSQVESVLDAWASIEVLSPATFRNPKDLGDGSPGSVVDFSNGVMPWQNGPGPSKPKYRLYYQIILGSIVMEPAVTALLSKYEDTRAQRPPVKGDAVLASVMVDKQGFLAGDNPAAISSFGWGVPVALAGNLRNLERWTSVEPTLVNDLVDRLTVKDSEGNPRALDASDINDAFTWLVNKLSLPIGLVKKPSFAVRTFQWNALPEAPEPLLLNSFFLKDLAWAKKLAKGGTLPANMQRYLGVMAPKERWNLMHNHAALRHVLSPARFPAGAWPAKGRYPLAPLQQCAVNIALHDLKDGGIVAVNGPPGTGKTTLLRDIVAAIVTERAKVMADFDDPDTAFTATGHRVNRGGAFLHLYSIDEKLKGFEIVVASSNNKAVENVSVELPGRDSIAAGSFTQGYFSTAARNVFGDGAWGTISAVLGSAKNRGIFRKYFWWDRQCGLQCYLRHASGSPACYTDGNGQQQIPPIIQNEDPPQNHMEALRRWGAARGQFKQLSATVEARLGQLQKIHKLYDSICQGHAAIDSLRTELPALSEQLETVKEKLISALRELSETQQILDVAADQRRVISREKPRLLSRLLSWIGYRAWENQHRDAEEKLQKAKDAQLKASALLEELNSQQSTLTDTIQKKTKAAQEISWNLEGDTAQYAKQAAQHAGVFVDAAFFAKSHADRQTTPPWLDAQITKLRGDLFESAMMLHKAFADAAAQKIRHNCCIFFESYGSRPFANAAMNDFIPDLWTTFFLLVPAVSTTFASVRSMFSGLKPESLGWLLVDEAGQALPQAAVGALLRAKRAVVVGDPLQIEPVVVLPESLTEKICENFSVDCTRYNAPGASVQTLADQAARYMGSFETQYGTRDVGVPLLVHRRCAEPMFSISNSVAYENLMVQAKQRKTSSIIDVAGPSCWLDVTGSAQGKWCPQEGQRTLELLQTMREGGCAPDLYIVTPFVDVQNGLRNLLRNAPVLKGWVGNPIDWVNTNVGTVHTVQGREAEAVIFVLGAPEPGQLGARLWAGKSPNLLNVAVTRAKEALYVVGNATAWKDCGVFKTLHARL